MLLVKILTYPFHLSATLFRSVPFRSVTLSYVSFRFVSFPILPFTSLSFSLLSFYYLLPFSCAQWKLFRFTQESAPNLQQQQHLPQGCLRLDMWFYSAAIYNQHSHLAVVIRISNFHYLTEAQTYGLISVHKINFH